MKPFRVVPCVLEKRLGDYVIFVYRYKSELYPEADAQKFLAFISNHMEISLNASGGSPQRIAVLQDGDHFGEIALVRNVPRIATVSALTPCLLLTLRSINFDLLLEKFPLFRDLMLKSTAERMH